MNRLLIALQALPIPLRLRRAMLRAAGLAIAPDANISPQVFFGSGRCIVGEGCFISVQCLIDGSDLVTLGRNVHLAMGVRLITSTHDIGPPGHRAGTARSAPVVIGDGSWLGAGCQVLPGVVVASGCVVATGAVVTRSTQPDGVYAGVPARRIRELGAAAGPGADGAGP